MVLKVKRVRKSEQARDEMVKDEIVKDEMVKDDNGQIFIMVSM